jgi:lipopolysaccharide heptosyltransferase II
VSDPAAGSRVVVRAPGWLGDAVLSLPAAAAIRRHFAQAHLTIAAPASVAAIFRETTDAAPDAVIELPQKIRNAVGALKAGAFDIGILFPNSFGSAWQFRRAGIPSRWGYPTAGRGILLTRRSRRPGGRRPHQGRGARHLADYYRDLVRGLEIACGDDEPRLAASAATASRADALLAERGVTPSTPLVGFAPGAAYGQAKQWPPERMAQVIAQLALDTSATSVIVGAAHDRDAGRAIESWLRAHAPAASSRVIDLVGRTTLGGLVGVTARMAVFVSNDSGAMHVAAALGRPVVAIFGPTDERVTRPLGDHDVITHPVFCRPCLLRDCPIDHRCMNRISVDTVVSAVTRRLAGFRTSRLPDVQASE